MLPEPSSTDRADAPAQAASARAQPLFRSLATKPGVRAQAGDPRPARMERLPPPRPGGARVAVRMVRWAVAGLRLALAMLLDRVTGRATPEQDAARIGDAIAAMGPAARKVARQFGFRLDLVTAEVAFRLATLEDHIPPLDIDVVVKLVEAATGGPLDRTFRAFDPTPLGSRVLRCTYLAELLDGTPVIVRVRPPGMRERLAAEVYAVGLLLGVLEALTIVRPGFFRYLQRELLELVTGESDFRLHARAQNLFRKRVREDRLRFASTTRALTRYTTDAVLVTRRVEGLRLDEVIAAAASDDPAVRAHLQAQNIDPRQVARRLLQLAWWELTENLFFHNEPTPFDVVVTRGGDLVPVHFHDIAVTSSQNRRRLLELFRRLDQDDVSGATEVLVQYLMPLPFIDTHTFTKRVEARLWHQLFAFRDRDAAWWERTSAGLWSALLDTTRESGVPVHLDVIHLVRSVVAYEGMALRLCPDLDPLAEFRRYQRKADRRVARRWRRDMRRNADSRRDLLTSRVAQTASLFQRAAFFLESAVENLPLANLAMPRKAAYVVSVVLQTATLVVFLAALGTFGLLAGRALDRAPFHPSGAALDVARHPAFLLLAAVLVVTALRRVMFRLSDNDPD